MSFQKAWPAATQKAYHACGILSHIITSFFSPYIRRPWAMALRSSDKHLILLPFSSTTYHVSPLVPSSTISTLQNTTSTTSMDTIKLEKLQAMKKYRRIQLFQTVFQYCLTFMVVILCLSKSVWFMSLCSAIKAFFLFTLPCVGAYVMTPKCLFVVCNVIVVILVGESKMVGSASSSSSSSDLYDDYVRRIRSQSLKSVPVAQPQVEQQKLLEYSTVSRERQLKIDEEKDEEDDHEDKEKEEDAEEEDPQDQKEDQGEEEEEERQEEEEEEEASEEEEGDKLEEVNESNGGEEDDNYLLTEELNRRVEDFIAKVNRQRRIEADMLFCGG